MDTSVYVYSGIRLSRLRMGQTEIAPFSISGQKLTVVSLGTGSKCIGKGKMSTEGEDLSKFLIIICSIFFFT